MNDSKPTANTRAIVVDEVFAHTPDIVWRALTTPALMKRWLLMEPTGFEPVVGNRFTYRTTPKGDWDGVIHCEVLESRENERLVYRWTSGVTTNVGYGAPLDTVVTLKLTPVDGGTRLHITHAGFRTPTNDVAHRNMGGGWTEVLGRIGSIADELDA